MDQETVPAASATRTRARPCPLCQASGNGATALHTQDGWTLARCGGCGFVFMPVVPEYAELTENLAWEVTHPKEALRRKREYPVLMWLEDATSWRLSIFPRTEPVDILNRQGAAGPVLDVGCGSGGFVRALAGKFTPYGVEISARLAAEAQALFAPRGGHVVQAPAGDGMAGFSDGFFAGAILRSYLEHDADARQVLFALRPKLRADGVVVIKVPNYGSLNRRVMGTKWCGFRYPDHVNYFTPASLRSLCEQAGFSVAYPWYLSLPTDDNVVAVLTVKSGR